jgi:hypothetical protein
MNILSNPIVHLRPFHILLVRSQALSSEKVGKRTGHALEQDGAKY